MPSRSLIERVRAEVDARLPVLLAEPGAPDRIVSAVRYAMLGGGKKFRPVLAVGSGEATAPAPPPPGGPTAPDLLDAACAIEMVHTFSLIHDDLPALDDDDLRRGRPTLHRQFDEATAVLAGDALLNLAYEVIAGCGAGAAARLKSITALSRAVGLGGMISGQVMDLEGEGRSIDAQTLRRTHQLKTGALITASCEIGGIIAGASDDALSRLGEYGAHLGLAFQIVDDILDVEGSVEDLGKSPGKDAAADKATFPALWGLDESRRRAARSVEEACAALEPLGDRAAALVALARSVLTRRG